MDVYGGLVLTGRFEVLGDKNFHNVTVLTQTDLRINPSLRGDRMVTNRLRRARTHAHTHTHT
jgi:hypothetical protein